MLANVGLILPDTNMCGFDRTQGLAITRSLLRPSNLDAACSEPSPRSGVTSTGDWMT